MGMGPITLFDKSFLQSLSVDESVWFDHFFLLNVCPIFYLETLADLDKSVRPGRTPQQEVEIIADKCPDNGTPNVFHGELCLADLTGNQIPLDGRIPLAGGRLVNSQGERSAVFDEPPEAIAFSRWRNADFQDAEQLFAKEWRRRINSFSLDTVKKLFRRIGFKQKQCKTLEEAKNIAEAIVAGQYESFHPVNLAALFFQLTSRQKQMLWSSWKRLGHSSLYKYSPYAAYVLEVELFYHLAVAADLISPRSRIDITYLFYLPFSMIFVSSDRLHQKCAPLFLRQTQEFVWGQDLKEDLRLLNIFYMHYPETEREKGIMAFAGRPPGSGDFLVTQLWDRHLLSTWRENGKRKFPDDPNKTKTIIEKIKKTAEAPPLSAEEVNFDPSKTDSLIQTKKVRKKKGSWWQLPKNLEGS